MRNLPRFCACTATRPPSITPGKTMIKLNSILVGILAVFAAPVALSQSVDCAALANSAGTEPAAYAQQCAFSPSANMSAPAPNAPTDTAFVYNVRAGTPNLGLARHVLNNMPGITNIGNPALTVFAMDFNVSNSTLFIVDSTTAATPLLRTLDQATGVATTIAPITVLAGEGVTDLTIDPQSGAAYLSTFLTGVGSRLYTINLTTGALTNVGLMTPTGLIIDLAVNCAGQMYAHDIGDDSLYTVNPATAAIVRIGTHGLAANFAQGMDFDNQDGQLYAWVYTGGGTYTFGTFNLATGAITPVNTNTPPGEWEGAIRNTCAPLQADLALTQSNTAPNPLTMGAQFTKTLTVTNNGPQTSTGITVVDTLPAQLQHVSNTCGATVTGQTVTWTIPTLANAATASCVLTVRVVGTGSFTNTATITASTPADPTPANNTSSVVFGGAPQVAVPMLGWLGLGALLAALGGLGLFTLGRRNA